MNTLEADVAIVGAGIAGLWSAKELIDRGLSVTVIEKERAVASGATTRNEGWLHAGTYHAAAVEKEADALQIVERTRFGHQAIAAFAPDAIDHAVSYALVAKDELANRAVERWEKSNVVYRDIGRLAIELLDDVSAAQVQAAFEVEDKSVDSVKLCRALVQYIQERGGRIVTNATFLPVDDRSAEVIHDGSRYGLEAQHFLITSGAGTKDIVREVTGQELRMRYFKAHLLVTPRLTRDNYFFIDNGEAGIMNHGQRSIVGINRDGIELSTPNYDVVEEKVALLRSALQRILGRRAVEGWGHEQILAVACCKPDLYEAPGDVQNLNVQWHSLSDGYTFAFPGKMTEAPYLACKLADGVVGRNVYASARPVMLADPSSFPEVEVALRPADTFMVEQVA